MQSAGSTVPAAEGHGCLCGALCISTDYTLKRWLEELVPMHDEGHDEGGIAPDVEQPLRLLFADTVRALRGDEMEFEPFLPDDALPLEQRTAALSQWCQGFLYGFGTARAVSPGDLPATIDEVLRDVADISRAEVDVGDAGEEEEQAYTEVVEYLRAGVQLVHDELTGIRNADVPAAIPPEPDADNDVGPDNFDPDFDPAGPRDVH
jgi:uncharacterized protein YgfB (UPF0149 family)